MTKRSCQIHKIKKTKKMKMKMKMMKIDIIRKSCAKMALLEISSSIFWYFRKRLGSQKIKNLGVKGMKRKK